MSFSKTHLYSILLFNSQEMLALSGHDRNIVDRDVLNTKQTVIEGKV